MSDCVLDEIYRSLANMTIGSVKSRNIDKIKLQVVKGDLPVRMLLPKTSGELEFVGIGSLNKITWVIQDLCLWAPLTAGKGIQHFAKGMVEYIQLYAAAIKALRNPTTQSVITGVGFELGPVPWADKDYWSIDTTLTVEEIL